MRLTAEQPPLMGGLKDLFTDFFGLLMLMMVMRVKVVIWLRVIVVMVVTAIEWWPPVSLSK